MRPSGRKIASKHLVQVATTNQKPAFAATRVRMHNQFKWNTNTGVSIWAAFEKKKRKKPLTDWQDRGAVIRSVEQTCGSRRSRRRKASDELKRHKSMRERLTAETAATASAGKNGF